MKSNIVQLIEHWSNTFRLPVRDKATIPDEKEIELIYNLIEEEFLEFKDAIFIQHWGSTTTKQDINITEVTDSLTDMLWLVIRAMQQFGLDVDKCVEAVYESNMSKLAYSYEEVVQTQLFYDNKGINTSYIEDNQGRFIVYNADTGKVLKSINFKEPKFEL